MFSFKGFITKDRNVHLEHLEDDIINRGSEGGRNAINFLKSVRDMLAGSSRAKVNMTVKWDGAPAIICGINPENGKFFVGTKAVFNKEDKKRATAILYSAITCIDASATMFTPFMPTSSEKVLQAIQKETDNNWSLNKIKKGAQIENIGHLFKKFD